jgi:hypothetical protein
MGGLKKREDRQAKTEVIVMGSCVDCGEPCYLYQEYMVKDETWAGAGMGPLGWLHIECLEKRLGRKLEPEELLCWPVERLPDGGARMQARHEYVEYVRRQQLGLSAPPPLRRMHLLRPSSVAYRMHP